MTTGCSATTLPGCTAPPLLLPLISRAKLTCPCPQQDQVLQRCYAAEPVLVVAASPDGVHLAGGGASGAVYLWETPSGRLLRSWPAHYKARRQQACLPTVSEPPAFCCAWSA